jgi:Na+/melibiose symporter-like transporter
MFNAAFALTSKATSGLGGFIAGVALDVVHFPTGVTPGQVDPGTVYSLGLAVGPGILIFWLIALLVLSRYPLTRAEHADIIRQLNARHADGTDAKSGSA